jgi:uncharacterized OB-fold protein
MKQKRPAIEGWFTLDAAAPSLIGTRCKACGTYFFPKETFFCRNPACTSSELAEVPLSRRGRLWSYTNNCYAPPHPYVASERMVVLGQVAAGIGVETLEVGMEMELALGTLFEDAERETVIWKWRPVEARAAR